MLDHLGITAEFSPVLGAIVNDEQKTSELSIERFLKSHSLGGKQVIPVTFVCTNVLRMAKWSRWWVAFAAS
jgi:hypothetical protein